MRSNRPIVLSLSGHDPSGGAGIQADIEAITSHQCHCCTVITALTEQDSCNVRNIIPQEPQAFKNQVITVMADLPVAAIKIGLIGQAEIAEVIYEILRNNPNIPIVLDPILAAGGGKLLADELLVQALTRLLIPLTTVLTPNSEEARHLTNQQNLTACGPILQTLGAQYVLITGTHEHSSSVNNVLYTPNKDKTTFTYTRLPYNYHGSGCTLASAIAALLAHGNNVVSAVTQAQQFTWETLRHAYRPGQGQHNPNRLFRQEVHS